jgi:hypothetical protein
MLWYMIPSLVVVALVGVWFLYDVAWNRGWSAGFHEDWKRRSQYENEQFLAWLDNWEQTHDLH